MPALQGMSGASYPTISGYEIVRVLGEGGMGTVYLGRQQTLNRAVCLKVLSASSSSDEAPEVRRERFRREAELLASISHPHILTVIDFGTTEGSGVPFLVTEYIEGGDLRRRMVAGRPLPTDQARTILDQVGGALEHLHEKGIIHRDLKPENILMPTDSLCKVGDFGLAVTMGHSGLLTRSERGPGTLGYVSPEQHYGLKVDERTDQYSLAAVAYELLTGRKALGAFPAPSRANPRLPLEVDAVLLRGLSEEPGDRYGSVREFLAALDVALARPDPRRRSGRVWLAGRLAAALAFLAILVGMAMSWTSEQPQDPSPALAEPVNGPAGPLADPQQHGAGEAPRACSPEFESLVRHRAYKIWVEQGQPRGKAGADLKEWNWNEAKKQIEAEVQERAYHLWEKQGRPEGPAGESVRLPNLRAAERQLLEETEEALRLKEERL